MFMPTFVKTMRRLVGSHAGALRRLALDSKGSVLLEQMTVFPIFASLFLLSLFAVSYHASAITLQRGVRTCAWQYAASGCKRLPPGCPAPKPHKIDDSALRAAAEGGFEKLGSSLPFLVGSLSQLHGEAFGMQKQNTVRRPTAFGGAAEVSATFGIMCNATTEEWHTAEVFMLTCQKLGIWCP